VFSSRVSKLSHALMRRREIWHVGTDASQETAAKRNRDSWYCLKTGPTAAILGSVPLPSPAAVTEAFLGFLQTLIRRRPFHSISFPVHDLTVDLPKDAGSVPPPFCAAPECSLHLHSSLEMSPRILPYTHTHTHTMLLVSGS
jgi:hypothetical protein